MMSGLLRALEQLCKPVGNALYGRFGKLVRSIELHFNERKSGSVDQFHISLVSSLPSIENKNHCCIQCWVVNHPANKRGRPALPYKKEAS